MSRVEVSNAELKTVRDAMRELNRLVDCLETGDAEKFVLTKRGQMRAVVISIEDFASMRERLATSSASAGERLQQAA